MTGPAALAVIAGLLVALQATVLAPLTRVVPPATAALWSQSLGVIAAIVLVAVARTGFAWPGAAAGWALAAGACTVGIVATIGAAVSPLGLAATLATVTGAQLLAALALDAAGVTGRPVPFDLARLLGVVLIVTGVLLVFSRRGTT